MADIKLFIELLARSTGLKTELNNSERGVKRFASSVKGEFDKLRQSTATLQGKLAGIGITLGAIQQIKLSANLDKGLTQLKQTAGETSSAVAGIRQEFFAMSRQTGRDVDHLKAGFDSLIQSGQSWRAALESTRGINIANAVTGANERTLSGGLTVGATAFNVDLEKPGQALVLLDKMTVAGRLGNAELENLSDIFARVGVNAASANMSFDKTLAFIESLSMVERQPERLATLVDSTLRLFTNLRYLAEAQKGTGVRFFDAKGARRDVVDVLKDIKVLYDKLPTDKSRAVFLNKAFGKADLDTIKGLKTLLSGDSLNRVSEFTHKISTGGGTLRRDLDDAVNNAVDQSGRLKSVLRQAGDEFSQPINKVLADLIKWGLDSKANGGLNLSGKQLAGGALALAGGTYIAARAGNAVIRSAVGRLGGTALGVAEGKALEAAAGVTPVFVTNWPAGGVPGGVPISTQGQIGKFLAPLAPLSLPAAVVATPFISAYISDQARANGWGSQSIRRGSPEYDVMGIGGREPVKNDIKIELTIDANGRGFGRSNNTGTTVAMTKRGSFFEALNTVAGMGY